VNFKTECIAALCFGVLMLQGCASIVSGTNQVVSVDTPGCPASSCELVNDKGKWYVNATPGTTTVNRAYGPLNATCKNGDVTATATFNSTTKGMAFGNILFGGVIGAGVDMSSGAAYDYPQTLSVPMSCTARRDPVVAARDTDAKRKFRLGIKAENLTPALAAAAGQPTTDGVIVTEVEEGGTGKALGLKVGHIVSEMNGRRVVNLDGLSADLSNAEEGDVEFIVFEGGKRFKVGRRKGSL
jgi:S1-C subfamily serine protease